MSDNHNDININNNKPVYFQELKWSTGEKYEQSTQSDKNKYIILPLSPTIEDLI